MVVLSPNFFEKKWTRRELDGLDAKELSLGKVVLPIWHNVNREDVLKHSPILADKLAVNTKRGLNNVVEEVLKAVQRNE